MKLFRDDSGQVHEVSPVPDRDERGPMNKITEPVFIVSYLKTAPAYSGSHERVDLVALHDVSPAKKIYRFRTNILQRTAPAGMNKRDRPLGRMCPEKNHWAVCRSRN